MGKKNSKSKKKDSIKGPKYTVEFTRRKLLLWLGVSFGAMVWMFVLGVIVGRDLSPVRFDVKKLEKELIALKEKALQTDRMASEVETSSLPEDPDLGFYEVLTDKREDAPLKFLETPTQTNQLGGMSQPAVETPTAVEQVKPRLKLAEVKKSSAKPDIPASEASEPDKAKREGLLTLQVASLTNADEAAQMVILLKRQGYEAYEVTVTLPSKGTYHRVRVGHFSSSDEASRIAARLKRDQFEVILCRE